MAQNVAMERNCSPVAGWRRDFSRRCRPFRPRSAGCGRGAHAGGLCADAGCPGRAGRRPDRHRQCLRDDEARIYGGAVQDGRHAARVRVEASLARYCGIQLAFAVADANAWHRRLGEAGFRTRPIAPFKRPVGTETGTDPASFTVARVEPGEMAEGRIQMLPHHTKDAVWQKRWLTHPNGARACEPCDRRGRCRRSGGALCAVHQSAGNSNAGRAGGAARSRADRFVTREAFAAALPEIAVPSLPFIAGYGVTVRSLDAAAAALRSGACHRAAPATCWSRRSRRNWDRARGCSARTARLRCSANRYFDKIPRSRSATAGGVA